MHKGPVTCPAIVVLGLKVESRVVIFEHVFGLKKATLIPICKTNKQLDLKNIETPSLIVILFKTKI